MKKFCLISSLLFVLHVQAETNQVQLAMADIGVIKTSLSDDVPTKKWAESVYPPARQGSPEESG